MSDAPTPQRAASAEERLLDALRYAVAEWPANATINVGFKAGDWRTILDRITAAEARAEEAEKRGSRDFWNAEARGMKAEADLIDLARMYGDACGKLANYREAAIHYAEQLVVRQCDASDAALDARDVATADRDRLADEVAHWKRIVVEAAIPLEAMQAAGRTADFSPELRAGVEHAITVVRRALTVTEGTTDGQA